MCVCVDMSYMGVDDDLVCVYLRGVTVKRLRHAIVGRSLEGHAHTDRVSSGVGRVLHGSSVSRRAPADARCHAGAPSADTQ